MFLSVLWTGVAAVLALHARFDTNKGQLYGMAFVEDNQRPDIELKLEGKYAEIDIEVCTFLAIIIVIGHHIFAGSKASPSWTDRRHD